MFNISNSSCNVNIPKMRTIIPILRTRGFVSFGLTGWLLIGGLAAMAAMGVALKIQSARLDAAQHKVTALEQSVAQWRGTAQECSNSVLEGKKQAEKRNLAALQAIRDARKGNDTAKAEIARLKALKPANSVCPAGDAVSEVRRGLVP